MRQHVVQVKDTEIFKVLAQLQDGGYEIQIMTPIYMSSVNFTGFILIVRRLRWWEKIW